MSSDAITRRGLLIRGLHLSMVAGCASLTAACGGSKSRSACVSDADLTSSERSLRASLRYEEPWQDAAQRCSGCAFFTSTDSSCGHCEMLSGVVSANGHCDSWSARK